MRASENDVFLRAHLLLWSLGERLRRCFVAAAAAAGVLLRRLLKMDNLMKGSRSRRFCSISSGESQSARLVSTLTVTGDNWGRRLQASIQLGSRRLNK